MKRLPKGIKILDVSIIDNLAIDIIGKLFPKLAWKENPKEELSQENYKKWQKLESIIFRELIKKLEKYTYNY